MSQGERLKSIRIKKGVSLEMVHDATKIPMDALRAIEESYEVRILTPFYIKGFSKIYAQYLGIDVREVIKDYRTEELPKPVKRELPEFEIGEWARGFFTRKRKQQLIVFLGIILTFIFVFKSISFLINREPKRPQTDVETSSEQSEILIDTTETSRMPSGNISHEGSPAVGSAAPVTKNVALTVRAKKNTWLSVKSDGKTVFQSSLNLGSVETWVADEKIEISGKNINYLDFELNGKMIGKIGRGGSRVRSVTVTKDGLKVNK